MTEQGPALAAVSVAPSSESLQLQVKFTSESEVLRLLLATREYSLVTGSTGAVTAAGPGSGIIPAPAAILSGCGIVLCDEIQNDSDFSIVDIQI